MMRLLRNTKAINGVEVMYGVRIRTLLGENGVMALLMNGLRLVGDRVKILLADGDTIPAKVGDSAPGVGGTKVL